MRRTRPIVGGATVNRPRSVFVFASAAIVLAAAALFVRATPAASLHDTATPAVAAGPSSFGRILFDGRGYALYAFTRDPARRPTCYSACAKAWPPFIVASRPTARTGVRASLLGVARRSDGRLQATYAGRPLYYYVGDTKAGVVLCQNVKEFGGLWLVVRGNGRLVR
jgi:predicted lipoprotein with Yx(FWY)xxD motif